jgi:hypothetical protein
MSEFTLGGATVDLATHMLWFGIALVTAMASAVILERVVYACQVTRSKQLELQYGPYIRRALDGDKTATQELAKCPSRHRLAVAGFLITPLIDDRDPIRITRTLEVVRAMSLVPTAERFLKSHFWWRRAVAIRALGLLQVRAQTALIIAALDDSNVLVRAAALDALTDLQDPASLSAIVVRLQDASLERGRRASALSAFGQQCEPLLLELARIDSDHRLHYARALTFCGSERALPALCLWTRDPRPVVRAAVFEAMARTGLGEEAAALAIEGLESPETAVRAMAAHALRGWKGSENAATHLARHLVDEWPVAVQAARALESMGETGLVELRGYSSRQDLAGILAQQMIWEQGARC